MSSNEEKASSVTLAPPGSPPNWIHKTEQSRSVTRMLADASSKAKPMDSLSRRDGVSKASMASQTEDILGRVGEGLSGAGLELTETLMLSLIEDDSFMDEVCPVARS